MIRQLGAAAGHLAAEALCVAGIAFMGAFLIVSWWRL